MSEEERARIVSEKVIRAPEYKGEAERIISENENDLTSRKKSLARDALRKIAEQFHAITGERQGYSFGDIETDVFFSNGSVDESVNKSITDTRSLARLLPVLHEAINGAVGIEAHDNRYFSDNNTLLFYELLGGYVNGEQYIPVRFGVKLRRDGTANLYVVVCQDQIEKAEVMAPIAPPSRVAATGSRSAYEINIAKVAQNVKSKDLLRYIPDGLLNEQQRNT